MARYRFDLIVSTACLALLGYLAWHAWQGPRSFTHRDLLLAKAAKLELTLAALKQEQTALDSRVQLMRPESIDPDMLDELARKTLEYAAPGEFILLDKP